MVAGRGGCDGSVVGMRRPSSSSAFARVWESSLGGTVTEAGELIAIWPGGSTREITLATPGKLLVQVANRGRRGYL
jgi:hypothetical protein